MIRINMVSRVLTVILLFLSLVNALRLHLRKHGMELSTNMHGYDEGYWDEPDCDEKGLTTEAVMCCFNKENLRLKKEALTAGSISTWGAIGSCIPVVGDMLVEPIYDVVNGVVDTAITMYELGEENCEQKGFEAVLEGVGELKNEMDKMHVKVDKLINEMSALQETVGKMNEEMHDRFDKIDSSQTTLVHRMENLEEKIDLAAETAKYNKYVKDREQIYLKLNEINGEFEVLLDNTQATLTIRQSRDNIYVTSKQTQEELKQKLNDFDTHNKQDVGHYKNNVNVAWNNIKTSFKDLIILLQNDDFLENHYDQVIKTVVGKWIDYHDDTVTTGSQLFKTSNINELIKNVREDVEKDAVLGMVAMSSIHYMTFAMLMKKAEKNISRFTQDFKDLATLLKNFKQTMSGKDWLGKSLETALQHKLPTVHDIALQTGDKACFDETAYQGIANTLRMVRWTDEIILDAPESRFANDGSRVDVYECKKLPPQYWPQTKGKVANIFEWQKHVESMLPAIPAQDKWIDHFYGLHASVLPTHKHVVPKHFPPRCSEGIACKTLEFHCDDYGDTDKNYYLKGLKSKSYKFTVKLECFIGTVSGITKLSDRAKPPPAIWHWMNAEEFSTKFKKKRNQDEVVVHEEMAMKVNFLKTDNLGLLECKIHADKKNKKAFMKKGRASEAGVEINIKPHKLLRHEDKVHKYLEDFEQAVFHPSKVVVT